jgi:Flp pilus assembly protein TadG
MWRLRIKMMKNNLRSFFRNESGMPAIEFAMVLPFMCLLYFGLVDATALISFNRKITASAGVTADLVAQQRTDVLKSNIDDIYNATAMVMAPTPQTDVRVEVYGYRSVNGTITKIWSTSNGNGPACGAAPATTSMASLMAAGNDVIVSRSCMNWTPYVVSFLGSSIMGASTFLISQSISVRPRTSLTLTCWQSTKAAGAVCV